MFLIDKLRAFCHFKLLFTFLYFHFVCLQGIHEWRVISVVCFFFYVNRYWDFMCKANIDSSSFFTMRSRQYHCVNIRLTNEFHSCSQSHANSSFFIYALNDDLTHFPIIWIIRIFWSLQFFAVIIRTEEKEEEKININLIDPSCYVFIREKRKLWRKMWILLLLQHDLHE